MLMVYVSLKELKALAQLKFDGFVGLLDLFGQAVIGLWFVLLFCQFLLNLDEIGEQVKKKKVNAALVSQLAAPLQKEQRRNCIQ